METKIPTEPAPMQVGLIKSRSFGASLILTILLGGLFHGGWHVAESFGPLKPEEPKPAAIQLSEAHKVAAVIGADFPQAAILAYEKVVREITEDARMLRMGVRRYQINDADCFDSSMARQAAFIDSVSNMLKANGFEIWSLPANKCEVAVDLDALKNLEKVVQK